MIYNSYDYAKAFARGEKSSYPSRSTKQKALLSEKRPLIGFYMQIFRTVRDRRIMVAEFNEIIVDETNHNQCALGTILQQSHRRVENRKI